MTAILFMLVLLWSAVGLIWLSRESMYNGCPIHDMTDLILCGPVAWVLAISVLLCMCFSQSRAALHRWSLAPVHQAVAVYCEEVSL